MRESIAEVNVVLSSVDLVVFSGVVGVGRVSGIGMDDRWVMNGGWAVLGKTMVLYRKFNIT